MRSSISQGRLDDLAMLSIEIVEATNLNRDKLIENFAQMKTKKEGRKCFI